MKSGSVLPLKLKPVSSESKGVHGRDAVNVVYSCIVMCSQCRLQAAISLAMECIAIWPCRHFSSRYSMTMRSRFVHFVGRLAAQSRPGPFEMLHSCFDAGFLVAQRKGTKEKLCLLAPPPEQYLETRPTKGQDSATHVLMGRLALETSGSRWNWRLPQKTPHAGLGTFFL